MPLPTDLFEARRLVSDPVERLTYESDAGPDRALPDGVVYPETPAEVARLAAWATRHRVPLVARGAGTGLAGGAVASSGGLVVVLTRMDRISDLDLAGRTVDAEAGVVNLELQQRVALSGLYYPPDPASGRSSLIGGNLGTNAGGPHCFKYGVTTNYVAALEAVLADGSVVTLGGGAVDAPEYDLAGLVVGSEGTLAIVTGAVLRLRRSPPAVRTMMVAFESLEAAGEAVSAVIAAGLVPATLEAIDQAGMRVIEEFCDAGLPVDSGAVLIVEVDGYEEGLATQVADVETIVRDNGAREVRVAANEEERERIWHGRKSAAGAMSRLAPSYYLTDITVRRSRLASVLDRVHRICSGHDLPTASFFHAGDGNLHPLIPCDPRDEERMDRVERALDEIVDLCLEEDGSITGEHGVGLEKRAQMARMHAGAELDAMHEVKRAFDPNNVLNPGKVLPDAYAPADRSPALIADGDLFVPGSASEAAGILRGLAAAGRATRLSGGRESDPDGPAVVSAAGLDGLVEMAPQDLFLTVGAGTRAGRIEEIVGGHGLVAPIVSPRPEATVGALIATNTNAPLRLRYGALRDNVLAARIAMTDGRVIRAGRPLVKNVAGYDLVKAFVGSHGTLGLVTEVTIKLAPAPSARRTLGVPVETLGRGLELARGALAEAIVASGVVLAPLTGAGPSDGDGHLLLYTAEGRREEVEAELDAVARRWRELGGEAPADLSRPASQAWADHLGWAGDDDLVVRAAVAPGDLTVFLGRLSATRYPRLCVDCAAGTVYGCLRADVDDPAFWLEGLREPAVALGGYAVAMRWPAALADRLDPWGHQASAAAVMRRLKGMWDPAGILPDAFLAGVTSHPQSATE